MISILHLTDKGNKYFEMVKGEGYTLKGSNCHFHFCLSSQLESTLKKKEFAPKGKNGLIIQENKKEIMEVVPPCENGGKTCWCTHTPGPGGSKHR